MTHSTTARAAALAAPVLAALFAGQASALNIVLTDVGAAPMTAAQLNAFQQAANHWENTFSDPITVNVNIAFDNLDNTTLGSTRTARTTHPFSTVRSAMHADATYSSEKNAVNSLPGSSLPVTIFSGPRNDASLTIATANAKALGLGTGLDTVYPNPPVGVDAEITFNTDFASTFDYDPADGITPGRTDFVAVAKHEIGHALGFFSVTDVQDFNPGFTLRSNTFDLWRFAETGAAHALGSERRLITAGDAEYYDSVLNNITLSHGSNVFDPLCNSSTGTCQASHWSDDRANLMDPTLAPGVLQDMEVDDRHALDYLGYNRSLIIICCIQPIPIWEIWWFWPFEEPPFPDFPFPPLPLPLPDPPPWANLGWVSVMDLGELGPRSGVGFARFEEFGQTEGVIIEPSPEIPGEMSLNPPGEPLFELPPTLYEMSFESDREGGMPFRFEATCGPGGCQYDPSIGEFGGYRIPGFIDGMGDGLGNDEEQDVDARVTLVMAADESVIPNPDAQNRFKLDDSSVENTLNIVDFEALGLEPPVDSDEDGVVDEADNCVREPNPDQRDTDGDNIGNACDADIALNDCVVNFSDLGTLKAAFFSQAGQDNWNPDADLNGDGLVNFGDLGGMKESFFEAPGPSGLPNQCQ